MTVGFKYLKVYIYKIKTSNSDGIHFNNDGLKVFKIQGEYCLKDSDCLLLFVNDYPFTKYMHTFISKW